MPSKEATKSVETPADPLHALSLEGLSTSELIEAIIKELRDAENDPDRAEVMMKPVETMMKFRRMTARNFR